MKKTATVAIALLAALLLAACGGGGGGETTATSTAVEASPPKRSTAVPGAASEGQGSRPHRRQGGSRQRDGVPGDASAGFAPPVHRDSGGGAKQFETRGGDNSVQEFGAEASGPDFEAAATALHGYLDARAAGAWRDACSYMSPGVAASLSQLASGESGKAGCPEILASLSTGLPPAVLREAARADVGALRTEGDRGFLLFEGAEGVNYFMPMTMESGSWKVAAIAPSALS